MGSSDPSLPHSGFDDFHSREQYDVYAPPGLGLSVSSTRAVLDSAVHLYRTTGVIQNDAVIQEALRRERDSANGRAIAADDVIPIVLGQVGRLHTCRDGSYQWSPLEHDPEWIRHHVLFAYNPTGARHDIPSLLADLFKHPGAKKYVEAISARAMEASFAVERSDIHKLAEAVNHYVTTFDEWMRGRLVNSDVSRIVDQLKTRMGNRLCGWKPPGGGAASSVVLLVKDKQARNEARTLLEKSGWRHRSVLVSDGMMVIGQDNGHGLTIRAPHRLDLVGAADLGQDVAIQTDGICCSMAILPYNQWQEV